MVLGPEIVVGQVPGAFPGPIRVVRPQPNPNQKVKVLRPNAPAPNEILVVAVVQEVDGPMRRLRGASQIETTELLLKADEVDYNEETGDAEARGNVKFIHFANNEQIEADKVEYNLKEETGKFYNVRGTSPAKIQTRPGILSTTNPFVFQGKWAEKLKDRYILHEGFITSCKLPKPWWRMYGNSFDIIPEQRAIAHKAVFRISKFPLFYTPYFYKSLEKMPRHSGFLLPVVGNSSRYGAVVNTGYFWAINRSFDLTYRNQIFTARGFAHHVDFRGIPNEKSDFNFLLFGVNDRGLDQGNGQRLKQGGVQMSFTGRALLGDGFEAKANLNYLSSYTFRQAFTQSFNEAIFSEVHSIAYITRHWSTFSFNGVFSNNEIFQSTVPDDKITIRKLPSLEFSSRDRQISYSFPIWVSFESSVALMRRTQPLFQTRQFVDRVDAAPRIMTVLRLLGFTLIPSFSARETQYGASVSNGIINGDNILRSSREVSIELIPPAMERTYNPPKWLGNAKLGDRLKHVIEPRASYLNVSGINDFSKIVRFDNTELMANTSEVEFSLTNRLYLKRKGNVTEILSWQVWQRRFLDPTFGGAVVDGGRNVIQSAIDMSAYAFLLGPRNYSPVVSVLRVSPNGRIGAEWRTDYDPYWHRITNSSLSADMRFSDYYFSVGSNQVNSNTTLTPAANQMSARGGFGNENRRGWNAGFSVVYDYRKQIMQYESTQVSYNSDCCGLSVQFRRFNFGTRNENQFRVAFAIANLGTFGTLKKNERLF
jgi:LPS-assembly protein